MREFCGVISAGARNSITHEKDGLCFNQSCKIGEAHLSFFEGESASIWEEDKFGILFSGKIFNATALSEQLDIAQKESDLLIHAYRKWGAEFPRYLEGDFAFVLWDCTAGRVLLGCGTEGNFPLFYTQHGEDLYFARNLRSLVVEMGVFLRINENYLAQWLALTFAGSDSTFFENVFRVVPGTVLIYEQGCISRNDYWQPEKIPQLHLRDSREYADGLREVLAKAVRRSLPDHSSVGSMLSGGLDSSTVTSLAAEILQSENRRLYAFTAVPEHPVPDMAGRYFCDEGPAAKSVAAMWTNIEHVLVPHGRHSVFKLMDLFGAEQMEPVFNPGNYDWLYEISLQAGQRQLDTLLIGDGGNISISHDGRFAMHTLIYERRFKDLFKYAWDVHQNSNSRWRGIVYAMLWPWVPAEIRCVLNKARGTFTDLFEYSVIQKEFAHRVGVSSVLYERNADYHDVKSLLIRHLRRPEVGTMNDIFRKITGVSRVDPTINRQVIEYCLSVPAEYYCEKGVPRSLIRNAMIGRLPEQVRTERRRGLQAADFTSHFEKEKEEAFAEFERMKKVDLVAQVLDLDKLEQMMQWSNEKIETSGGMSGYWPKFLRAFSLGRFLRQFEDGTLLNH